MSALRIGGLFFGYGGLDLAAQSAIGGELAWVSEIDKGALKVIGHRFPGVPNIGDITAVDWSQVEPVDVLTGGSPCQDLSHAGKRQGMTEGTRSNLWVAMREAIAQLRPSLVVWENVRGAGSAEAASDLEHCPGCMGDGRSGPVLRALGRVVGDLSDLGYVGQVRGLRAADIGAPHGRFRYFLTAYPEGDARWLQHGDCGAAADAQGGSESDRAGRHDTRRSLVGTRLGAGARDDAGNPASGVPILGRGAGLLPSPRTSDTNGAGAHGQGGLDLRTAVSLLPTPNAGDAKQGYVSAEDHEAKRDRKAAQGIHLQDDLPQVATTVTDWGQYAAAIARWEALTRPAPPPTETGPKGNPRLSAAFSEWMMGLPAGWVTDVPGITRNEALKALGNGVAPQQAAAALRIMLARESVAA